MASTSFFNKLAGAGYITLNIIRALNIIALLLVVVASWIMLVMTVENSSFFFFDGVTHFVTSVISLFLILSESMLFQNYFRRVWPVLGPEFGFVCLGSAMIVLGFDILGNLNKDATSVDRLGLPMWRTVISAGILSSVIGFFNLVATIVFCDSKQGITARQVRSQGAVISKEPAGKAYSMSSSGGSFKSHEATLPSYHASNPETRRNSKFGMHMPYSISKPVVQDPEQFEQYNNRSSPIIPDVQRPPSALHPYNAPATADQPMPPPSSRYSVVSNISRFTSKFI